MRRAVITIVVALAFLAAGCFPHNAKRRHIALGIELGVLGAGVAVLTFAKPGADCDSDDDACRSRADLLSGLGVVLLIAGLAGLVATISSAEDADSPPPKKIEEAKPEPEPTKPEPTKPQPTKPEPTPEPEPEPTPEPAPPPAPTPTTP